MIKAVVFDLDDTLYPEKQYTESGFHHVASIISKSTNISEIEIFSELIKISAEDEREL